MEATVLIRRFEEYKTKRTGLMRYVMYARRVEEDHDTNWIPLTTLNAWRASLCKRAWETERPVTITYRGTGYFDFDLLSVSWADEQVA